MRYISELSTLTLIEEVVKISFFLFNARQRNNLSKTGTHLEHLFRKLCFTLHLTPKTRLLILLSGFYMFPCNENLVVDQDYISTWFWVFSLPVCWIWILWGEFTCISLLGVQGLKHVLSQRRLLINDCKYMEITYVNRGLRIEYGSNPRSYEHYLSSGENEAFFHYYVRLFMAARIASTDY